MDTPMQTFDFLQKLQSILQNATMWLLDTGVLNKLNNDIFPPLIPVPNLKFKHKEPLVMEQLGITMILLLIGIFISILAFCCELLHHKKKRHGCSDKDTGQRIVSEWIYTNHQYNWRQKHTHFVSC